MNARRYRRDANGDEQPVWASKRRIEALGTKEGRDAFNAGRLPIRMSNVTHDEAAQKEYDRLVAERGEKTTDMEVTFAKGTSALYAKDGDIPRTVTLTCDCLRWHSFATVDFHDGKGPCSVWQGDLK